MNQDKARELFSAYYEETLETGLRQQLENRFRADANLKADYAAFVETIESLDDLRFEEIEVPLSLNDRIATRLEQEEAKRRRPALLWGNWLRGLGFSGLAAAAVLAAFVAIRSEGTGSSYGAGLIPSNASTTTSLPTNRLVFSAEGKKVLVSYRTEDTGSVTVSAAGSGREIQKFPLSNSEVRTPLENTHPGPALLRVTASGDAAGATIVLPGTDKQTAKSGSGTLLDLASAVAGYYGAPVVVRGNTAQNVVWNFDSTSALRATETALAGTPVSADQRDGDLITILGN